MTDQEKINIFEELYQDVKLYDTCSATFGLFCQKDASIYYDDNAPAPAQINMANFKMTMNPQLIAAEVAEVVIGVLENGQKLKDVFHEIETWSSHSASRKYDIKEKMVRLFKLFLTLHEIGHYLYSPNCREEKDAYLAFCDEITVNGKNLKAPFELAHFVANVVEDVFIQKQFRVEYPGKNYDMAFRLGQKYSQGDTDGYGKRVAAQDVVTIYDKLYYFILRGYNEYDAGVLNMWGVPEKFGWSKETCAAFDEAQMYLDKLKRLKFIMSTVVPSVFKDLVEAVDTSGMSPMDGDSSILDQDKLRVSDDDSQGSGGSGDESEESEESEDGEGDGGGEEGESDGKPSKPTKGKGKSKGNEEEEGSDEGEGQGSEEGEGSGEGDEEDPGEETGGSGEGDDGEETEGSDETDGEGDDEGESEGEEEGEGDDGETDGKPGMPTDRPEEEGEESEETEGTDGINPIQEKNEKSKEYKSVEEIMEAFEEELKEACEELNEHLNETEDREAPPEDALVPNDVTKQLKRTMDSVGCGIKEWDPDINRGYHLDQNTMELYRTFSSYFQKLLTLEDYTIHRLDQGEIDPLTLPEWYTEKNHAIYALDVKTTQGREFRVIFILDMSGSMGGRFTVSARIIAAMTHAMNDIGVESSIYLFDDKSVQVKQLTDPVVLNGDESSVYSTMERNNSEGSTNPSGAFDALVYDPAYQDDAENIVFFFTDGSMDNEDVEAAVQADIEELSAKGNWHFVCIGIDFRQRDIDRLASFTKPATCKSYTQAEIKNNLGEDIYNIVSDFIKTN